jgi:hypothetical protein
MYELLMQNEVKQYNSRQDAVTAAKEFTASSDSRMTVNVTDGVESMQFRSGKLVAYSYETRKADGRDNSRDDSSTQSAPAAEKKQAPVAEAVAEPAAE